MTIMRINNMRMWEAQNKAEAIDCIEGCLLDNVWYSCKGGEAFVFEEYLNANSSGYKCYFFREHEKDSKEYLEILKSWQDLYEAIYGDEEETA